MKPNGTVIHDQFSRFWYETGAPLDMAWMGVPIVKCALDMWVYQEILVETKPELIIETGTFMGGSALFLAHMLDLIHGPAEPDEGRDIRAPYPSVLSIDIATDRELPAHPRIDFLAGMSSTSKEVLEHVAKAAHGKRSMVILDSAHNRKHVLKEMQLYQRFVSKGCYMIVEDTNVHGYPYGIGDIDEDGGPGEAVRDFQPKNNGFEIDRRPERFRMSQNPGGYLRRVR